MLLKGLYELSEFKVEKGSFSAKISFDPEHYIFKGHFPGQPVVPGVCLIHIVKELASMVSGEKFQLKKGSNVKFIQLIDPQKNPGVIIKGKSTLSSEGQLTISATILYKEDTFFKFKGIFS